MKSVQEVLHDAALSAGKAVRESVPSSGMVEKEGRANFVTAADLASEKIIMDAIRTNFPDHEILSEETTSAIEDPLKSPNLWVIDPIDGTNNFRYERAYSAISIGYVEQGELVAAAAYDPFRDQLFMARRGEGATMNGQEIHVSEQSDLARAVVGTDNSYDPAGTRRNVELMLKPKATPWYLMRGSAVLTMCDIAAGRMDMYFHTVLKPWDNAAAFLIAHEAGATIKGIDGKPVNFMSPHVVMGNHDLVTQFLAAIN